MPISDVNAVMACQNVSDVKIPVRAFAFVQGSTIGIIGAYHPNGADEVLIDELRRAVADS